MATGYFGSPNVMTSNSNTEIVQIHKPQNWSATMLIKAYRLTFVNFQACTVKINGSAPIYLPAGSEFAGNEFIITETDAPVYSFEIVEPNIQYYYYGAY